MMPHSVPVYGAYPGPIDTDMTQHLDVTKGTPTTLATRLIDGIEEGVLDITTDSLSDHFVDFLKPDMNAIGALKKEFDKRSL